jgi:hypothetical protein
LQVEEEVDFTNDKDEKNDDSSNEGLGWGVGLGRSPPSPLSSDTEDRRGPAPPGRRAVLTPGPPVGEHGGSDEGEEEEDQQSFEDDPCDEDESAPVEAQKSLLKWQARRKQARKQFGILGKERGNELPQEGVRDDHDYLLHRRQPNEPRWPRLARNERESVGTFPIGNVYGLGISTGCTAEDWARDLMTFPPAIVMAQDVPDQWLKELRACPVFADNWFQVFGKYENQVAWGKKSELVSLRKASSNVETCTADGAAVAARFMCVAPVFKKVIFGTNTHLVVNVRLSASFEADVLAGCVPAIADDLCELVVKTGARLICGNFRGVGGALMESVRQQGFQVNLLAWAPRVVEATPVVMGHGTMILVVGPAMGIWPLHAARGADIPLLTPEIAAPAASTSVEVAPASCSRGAPVASASVEAGSRAWTKLGSTEDWPPRPFRWMQNAEAWVRTNHLPILHGAQQKEAAVQYPGVVKLLAFIGSKPRRSPEHQQRHQQQRPPAAWAGKRQWPEDEQWQREQTWQGEEQQWHGEQQLRGSKRKPKKKRRVV